MEIKQEIQHIFFDLDHTLWDYETSSKQTLTEIFEKNKFQKQGKTIQEFIRTFDEVNYGLWEKFNHGKIDRVFLRTQRFKLIFEKMELSIDINPTEISDEYIYNCCRKNNLMPDAKTAICYLAEKYQLHIITNGFDEVQQIKTNTTGIAHFFDKFITSDSVGVKKPYPEIFEYALEITGATKQNSLMIGDNPNTDIKGAMDFGMRAILYNPNFEKYGNADFEINSHLELMKLL